MSTQVNFTLPARFAEKSFAKRMQFSKTRDVTASESGSVSVVLADRAAFII